jgi:hypothetical protein
MAICNEQRSGYSSWVGMKSRCLNPKQPNYVDYGGRGITVCSGLMAYQDFHAVMGDRPEGMSIDRIDNDGGYCCGNCAECKELGRAKNVQWATRSWQNKNKRRRGATQSRFPGVWHEGNRWRCGVSPLKLSSHLTEEEAAYALDRYVTEMGIDWPLSGVTEAEVAASLRRAHDAGLARPSVCASCAAALPAWSGAGRPRKVCLKCAPRAGQRKFRRVRGRCQSCSRRMPAHHGRGRPRKHCQSCTPSRKRSRALSS